MRLEQIRAHILPFINFCLNYNEHTMFLKISHLRVTTLMLQNFIIYFFNSYFFNYKECIIVLWLWTQLFQTAVGYYVSILHIGMEFVDPWTFRKFVTIHAQNWFHLTLCVHHQVSSYFLLHLWAPHKHQKVKWWVFRPCKTWSVRSSHHRPHYLGNEPTMGP
jgi:hypothetical protein